MKIIIGGFREEIGFVEDRVLVRWYLMCALVCKALNCGGRRGAARRGAAWRDAMKTRSAGFSFISLPRSRFYIAGK